MFASIGFPTQPQSFTHLPLVHIAIPQYAFTTTFLCSVISGSGDDVDNVTYPFHSDIFLWKS